MLDYWTFIILKSCEKYFLNIMQDVQQNYAAKKSGSASASTLFKLTVPAYSGEKHD